MYPYYYDYAWVQQNPRLAQRVAALEATSRQQNQRIRELERSDRQLERRVLRLERRSVRSYEDGL